MKVLKIDCKTGERRTVTESAIPHAPFTPPVIVKTEDLKKLVDHAKAQGWI